jgi:hypothetical protein
METERSSNDAVPRSLTRLTEHRDAGASADTTYGRAPGVRVRASFSRIIPSTTEPTQIANGVGCRCVVGRQPRRRIDACSISS